MLGAVCQTATCVCVTRGSYAQRSVNPGPMLLEVVILCHCRRVFRQQKIIIIYMLFVWDIKSGVHVDEEPANLFPVPSAEASATLHKTR